MDEQTFVTDNEDRDLHFDKPRHFIVLNQTTRMVISRNVYDGHLVGLLNKPGNAKAGTIVYAERYVDCHHCRERRIDVFKRKPTFFHRPEISYGRDSDDYWCNTCQGSGWITAPLQQIVDELNIRTVEQQLQSLSSEEFTEILLTPVYSWPYAEHYIKQEAARRMASNNAQSKESTAEIA
jgi:hypothetical protein